MASASEMRFEGRITSAPPCFRIMGLYFLPTVKTTKRALIFVAALIVLSCCYFAAWLFFWRYPTVYEATHYMTGQMPGKQFVITTDQSDVGLFGVDIEDKESIYIETIPQWIFPWEKYDWSPTDH